MAEIIVAFTIIGNIILFLLLLYRDLGLRWFTLTTGLAVLVDCLFYFLHGFDHRLYGPLRLFIVYWLFPILELIVAFEAVFARLRWLEYLMLAQVALAATAGLAHLHGDKGTVYRLEMFICYFNLAGIMVSIFKLRKDPSYD